MRRRFGARMSRANVTLADDARPFEIGPLDPDDAEPLYRQLHDRLRDKLLNGWPSERPIPSERYLMRQTGLSRMTVRQAIADLVHEGMLRRDQGRGTFLADSRLMRLLTGHSSFREIVRREGKTPSTRVLRQEIIRADATRAALLEVDPGEPIFDFVRLRLVDDAPVMVTFTNIAVRICPELETADLRDSLYAFLANRCGLPPQHSSDTIEAVAAKGEVAQLLQVDEGTPLLLLRRLARSAGDLPLEITDEYVRPDKCLYRVENPSGSARIDLVQGQRARPVEPA